MGLILLFLFKSRRNSFLLYEMVAISVPFLLSCKKTVTIVQTVEEFDGRFEIGINPPLPIKK